MAGNPKVNSLGSLASRHQLVKPFMCGFLFQVWPHRELFFFLGLSTRMVVSWPAGLTKTLKIILKFSSCKIHRGLPTLRALLSGTFLQTLPDFVTPLKGHSLSPRSCPPTRSAPSERFGYYYDCGSNLAPKQARKHEPHPPQVKINKKEFHLDSNDCGFICAGVNFVASCK